MRRVGVSERQAGWHRRKDKSIFVEDTGIYRSCPSSLFGTGFFYYKITYPDPDFKKCKGDNTMKEKKEIPYKIYLTEEELPTQYYDVRADMEQKPSPLLNPAKIGRAHV